MSVVTTIAGIDTRVVFTLLVAAVGLERGVELVLSRRNVRRALERGAIEVGRREYRTMVALHATFLPAALLEVWLAGRPWIPALAGAMALLVAGTMALRYWVVLSLGERWSTRVVVLPGQALVEHGPYRWLRHPNYLAVAIEIAALPLVHGAWLTALVYTVWNAFVLRARVSLEDGALRDHAAPRTAYGARG